MKTTTLTAARILALLCVVLAPLSAQQAAPQSSAPPRQMIGYIIGQNDVLRVAVFSGGNSQEEFR